MHESSEPQLCGGWKKRRESRSFLELRQLKFHEIPWENRHLGWMGIQVVKKGINSIRISCLTCYVTMGSSQQIRVSYNPSFHWTWKERSAKCLQVLQWIKLQWNVCLFPGLDCSLLGNSHWVQSEFCTAEIPGYKANKRMEPRWVTVLLSCLDLWWLFIGIKIKSYVEEEPI